MNPQSAGPDNEAAVFDIYESRAAHGRAAWRRLGLRLQAITPTGLLRGLLSVGAFAFIVWATVSTWPALLPFAGGLVVVYLLLPVVNAMDRVMPRALASLIAVVSFFVLVGLLLAIILRPIVEQLGALIVSLPPADTLQQSLDRWLTSLSALPEPIVQAARDSLRSSYESFVTQQPVRRLLLLGFAALSSLFGSVAFILGLFVVPAWLLTVIKDYNRGTRAANRLLPEWMRPDVLAVARIIDRSLKSFIRIQGTSLLAVAAIMYLAIALLQREGLVQFQYPLVNALFPAVMQLVPTFGVFFGAIPALVHALFVSPRDGLLIFGIYIGALWLSNFLFGQRLQRRLLDMHNALLLLVLVVLSAFGPLWVLLSAPIAAIVRDLFRYVYGRLSDPPRPAGVLPGEPVPGVDGASSVRPPRVPLVYRRQQSQR